MKLHRPYTCLFGRRGPQFEPIIAKELIGSMASSSPRTITLRDPPPPPLTANSLLINKINRKPTPTPTPDCSYFGIYFVKEKKLGNSEANDESRKIQYLLGSNPSIYPLQPLLGSSAQPYLELGSW